jgi:PhnB protein
MSGVGVTLEAPRGRARLSDRVPAERVTEIIPDIQPLECEMPSLNPYLSFKNQARDAMEFYQGVFGGDLTVSTFAEYPGMGVDPSEENLVMHAQLQTPDGFVLMGSDTPSHMEYEKPAGISVSVSGDDEPSLQGYWDKLADGGSVSMPFDTPPWGGKFGMLTDRYGIDWMVAVNAAQD